MKNKDMEKYLRVMPHQDGPIVVRKGQPEDAALLVLFLSKVASETNFTTLSTKGVPTAEILRLKINEYLSNITHLHITAFQNNGIIGQLSFRPIHLSKDFPTENKGSFGIAVLKAFWGSGVSKIFMEIMETHAQTHNIFKIEASVKKENQRGINF